MDLLVKVALSCLNVPYLWGGSNPLTGFDCSGFLQWCFRSVGMDPPGDQTAQGYFDHFEKLGGDRTAIQLGTLLFYGKSVTKITHVALALTPYQLIEAGGGDSTTTTLEEAKKRGAMVRISHIGHRSDLVATIRPSYAKIGLI